jgi:hypothetical protein
MEVDQMVFGTQILGVIFVLVMVYLTFLYYKRHEFGKMIMAGWMVLWLGTLFLIIFPSSVNLLLEELNIGSATQLLMIFSIMILFGFVFLGSVKLKNIERKIDELGRSIALRKRK